jgi:hypothetical protein
MIATRRSDHPFRAITTRHGGERRQDQGALARNHTDGDFASRQSLRLVVTAQQGAIRLGGYYEIEVKGATAFEGPTLGVSVRPIMSEKLVK